MQSDRFGVEIHVLVAGMKPAASYGNGPSCALCYNLCDGRNLSVVFTQLRGETMRLSQSLGALVLMASASIAHAQLSGTVTAISDYNWRGITQSADDPALQGSIDWAADSGVYVGAWASNIDFGNSFDSDIEVDLYGGIRGGDDLAWDFGLIYYMYPGETDANWPELYASLTYGVVTGKISYTNEFGGFSNDSALYYELGAGWELPENFGLNAHIGYSDGDGINDAYAGNVDDYFDWSAGVTYTLGNFVLGLKYVDGSDLEAHDGTPGDISSSEAKAVFSVSTTFPWGSE